MTFNLSSGFASFAKPCGVCQTNSGRSLVVGSVLSELVNSGSFAAGSVTDFWQSHSSYLCTACLGKLSGIRAKHQRAVKLLEEALQLDRSNQSIRRNLDAIRNL